MIRTSEVAATNRRQRVTLRSVAVGIIAFNPLAGCALALLWAVWGAASGISGAHAADHTWGWFAATSNIDKWSLNSGDARVDISGGSFSASLYDPRDRAVAVTLKGTIRNDRVEVDARILSTDDAPRHLVGVYKRTQWKNASTGRESILLTESGEPGGLTIGLTREVKREVK